MDRIERIGESMRDAADKPWLRGQTGRANGPARFSFCDGIVAVVWGLLVGLVAALWLLEGLGVPVWRVFPWLRIGG